MFSLLFIDLFLFYAWLLTIKFLNNDLLQMNLEKYDKKKNKKMSLPERSWTASHNASGSAKGYQTPLCMAWR